LISSGLAQLAGWVVAGQSGVWQTVGWSVKGRPGHVSQNPQAGPGVPHGSWSFQASA